MPPYSCRSTGKQTITSITDVREMKARIVVFGVGGAGGNAINNMITAGLQGVDFIVANCAYRKSSPSILVMQSTQDRTAQNAPRYLGGT